MLVLDEPVASFLPLDLLRRIHAAGGGARPAAVEIPAAALFIDVSRYTSLVDRLTRRGPEGLERIPDLLGRVHSRCVERVYEFGGEVLQSAGDSLTAYWAGDGFGLQAALSAATQCAESICRGGDDAPDIFGDAELTLPAGVGAGRIWAAALGGQPNWSVFVGGDAIKRAASAQADARPGEYVVASGPAIDFELSSSVAEPRFDVSSAPPADWLVGFLPLELRRAMGSAGIATRTEDSFAIKPRSDFDLRSSFDALSEIRPITALFARITGAEDGPDALARHHRLYTALQEELRQSDGPGGELVVDDKGMMFFAVFGTFGSFHRDDAGRALEAARAVSRTTNDLGMSASIGVATGDALFHVVGDARRRQLMVLGSPMDRASRLMTATTDGVLCDAPTERAGRSRFSFQERGTLQLQGLGDTSAVFSPLAARTAVAARPSLIGRERELDVLHRALAEVRHGARRVVIVSGEPGIGKTHLVETFVEGLSESSVAVSRAERDDRRTSLRPWRRVLASLLQLPRDADGARVLAAITSRFADDPQVVGRLALLDGMLGVQVLQTDSTRHLDGAHRADASMRLLGDLLR